MSWELPQALGYYVRQLTDDFWITLCRLPDKTLYSDFTVCYLVSCFHESGLIPDNNFPEYQGFITQIS